MASCPFSGVVTVAGLAKSIVSAQLVVSEVEFHSGFYSILQYYLGCDYPLSVVSSPDCIFDLLRSSAPHVSDHF